MLKFPLILGYLYFLVFFQGPRMAASSQRHLGFFLKEEMQLFSFMSGQVIKHTYRVFIKYCVFSLKFCDFSELCQFCCSACVLPAWLGKTEKGQGPEYFKILRKNTIFNEHPVYCRSVTQVVSFILVDIFSMMIFKCVVKAILQISLL